MNERIKVLAEQAKFMTEEDINRQISYNTELKAFAEKFAELIVGECAKACEKNSWMALNGFQRSKQIKEHFGVEE